MVGTEFNIGDVVFQNVVRRGEHGGGHREDGFLWTASTFETEELRAKVRVPRASRHPGDLDECGLEPRIAGSCSGREPFPGTLIQARTETCPGHEVACGWKPAHIH